MVDQKIKKTHFLLIGLIIVLAVGLVLELWHEGMNWLTKEKNNEPICQNIPVYSADVKETDYYKEMERVQRNIDKWVYSVFRNIPEIRAEKSDFFIPDVDVNETDVEYIVRCDLPGMKKEEIDISLSGDYLTISGSRVLEKDEDKGNYYCQERRFGFFRRAILLPALVSESEIKAEYNNGVLTIKLQKLKSSSITGGKKIQVT